MLEEREPFNAEYKAKKAAYDEAKKVYMPSRKVAERAANGRQKHGKAAKAAHTNMYILVRGGVSPHTNLR